MRFNKFSCVLVALILSACNREVDEAKRRYELVKHSSASAVEICSAGQKLVDAYLKANDAKGYRDQQVFSSIECSAAIRDDAEGKFRDNNGNVMAPLSVEATDRLAGINVAVPAPEPVAKPKLQNQKPGDPCYNAGPDC